MPKNEQTAAKILTIGEVDGRIAEALKAFLSKEQFDQEVLVLVTKDGLAETLKDLVTNNGLAEKLKGYVTGEELRTAVEELLGKIISEERINELVVTALHKSFAQGDMATATLEPYTPGLQEEKPPLPAEALIGLKFRGSRPKKNEGVTTHIPFERDLTPKDVLNYREENGKLIITAADGQKHTVKI